MSKSSKRKLVENDSDFSRDLEEDGRDSPARKEEGIQTNMEPERPSVASYLKSSQGHTSWAATGDDPNILRVSLKDKLKIEEYIRKYAEKFFKVYKKLNVKVVSKEVVNRELDPAKPLLLALDSVSGHLNKVLNQVTQFLKQNDTEILQYKNIIAQKLRPQLQKLIEENNRLRSGQQKREQEVQDLEHKLEEKEKQIESSE